MHNQRNRALCTIEVHSEDRKIDQYKVVISTLQKEVFILPKDPWHKFWRLHHKMQDFNNNIFFSYFYFTIFILPFYLCSFK